MGKGKKESDNVSITVQGDIKGDVTTTVISGHNGPVVLNGNIVTHYEGSNGNLSEFSNEDGAFIVCGDINHGGIRNTFGGSRKNRDR